MVPLAEFTPVRVKESREARIVALIRWKEFALFDHIGNDQSVRGVGLGLDCLTSDNIPSANEPPDEARFNLLEPGIGLRPDEDRVRACGNAHADARRPDAVD